MTGRQRINYRLNNSCVTVQGLCRAKLLLKALSAKDGVLEKGVMWEQIPGATSLKVSLSSGRRNCHSARVLSAAISCCAELEKLCFFIPLETSPVSTVKH